MPSTLPFNFLRLHYGNETFELRHVFRKKFIKSRIQQVKGVFKIIAESYNFEECLNVAVAKMAEMIEDSPEDWCLQIEHASLRSSTNSLFINYDPNVTDVGQLAYQYLQRFCQSGCTLDFADCLFITIIATPKPDNDQSTSYRRFPY